MKKIFIIDALDKLVTVLGVVLIGYGLYQIYPPLCWIVIGSIMAFPSLPRKGVD